jgi:hypothetical protein
MWNDMGPVLTQSAKNLAVAGSIGGGAGSGSGASLRRRYERRAGRFDALSQWEREGRGRDRLLA